MKSYVALAGAFVLVLSACASSESFSEANSGTTTSTTSTTTPPETTPTTAPGPRTLVVTITEDGGCFMMGPNCATYLVYSDGSVELMRTRELGEPEATTTVDPDAIQEVTDLLASTDPETLRASLPEGECQGCFDGIDTTFTYETTDGQVSFASTEVELVLSESLFAATWQVRNAAAENLELGMQTWPSG